MIHTRSNLRVHNPFPNVYFPFHFQILERLRLEISPPQGPRAASNGTWGRSMVEDTGYT